ncbi:MAG: PACE efflux transporter [Rhodocyclaceae bacterium]
MPQPVSSQACSPRPRPPRLRSFVDRCRQVALFELGGLLLITPPFAWLSGVPITESIALLAMLSLIAAIWNGSYNTSFDWIEGRLTGRSADRRPLRLRVVHAIGFEVGLFAMTWPVIVWWTGMGWMEAFVADIALALTYVIYAFAFNLGYDRLFPIAQFEGGEGCDASPSVAAAAADSALAVAPGGPARGCGPDAPLDLALAAQPRSGHG